MPGVCSGISKQGASKTGASTAGAPTSRRALGLLLLVGAAAAVRAVAWSRTVAIFNDGPVFLSMAEAMLDGRWEAVLAHPYHPLYPGCIGLVSLLLPVDLEAAAVLVSIAGGVGAVAAIHLWLRDAFGDDVAWLGGWMAALHPSAVDFSSDVMSDGLYAGLYLAGFAWLSRGDDRASLGWMGLAGAMAGLAYWVRPEGIGLLIVGACSVGWRAATEPPGRRRRLGGLALLLVVGAIVASPYVLALEARTGELALTRKKSLQTLATGAQAPPARSPRATTAGESPTRASDPARSTRATDPAPPAYPTSGEEEVGSPGSGASPVALPELAVRSDGPGAQKPPRSARGLLEAHLRVLRTALSAFRYEAALLALPGLLLLVLGRVGPAPPRWPLRTLALATALYGAVLVLLVWGAGYVSRRHALPFLLPGVALPALGLRWTLRAAKGSTGETGAGTETGAARWLRGRRWLPIGLIVLLGLGWGLRDLRPRRVERAAVRSAAEWLAMQHPGSGPVAGQKLRAAYYAGAPFVPLPPGHDGRLEAVLRERGARWIVIDEEKYGDHIGIAEGVGAWLRPVHRVEAAGRTAVVLEIAPSPAG
ncbi:MAG: glycosyltransferase family 39 protein [bacterium]